MNALSRTIKEMTAGNVASVNSNLFSKVQKRVKKESIKGKRVGESMKEKELKEGVLDATDDDGWVAKEQLYKTAKYAIELHQMISDSDEVQPWLQVKITEAADRLSSVKHYLEYLQASIGQGDLPQMSGSAMVEPEQEVATMPESIENELAQLNSIKMNTKKA
jgi:hypothetical protein